jgi:hypothetical protein
MADTDFRRDTKFRRLLKDPNSRIPFSVQENWLLLWEEQQRGPQPASIRRSTFSLSKFLAERHRSRQQDDHGGEKSEVMTATAGDSMPANEAKDDDDGMLSSEMGNLRIAA